MIKVIDLMIECIKSDMIQFYLLASSHMYAKETRSRGRRAEMLKLDNGPSSVDTTSTGCNQKSSAQPEFPDGPKVHNNKSQTAGEVLLSTFSYSLTTYLRYHRHHYLAPRCRRDDRQPASQQHCNFYLCHSRVFYCRVRWGRATSKYGQCSGTKCRP